MNNKQVGKLFKQKRDKKKENKLLVLFKPKVNAKKSKETLLAKNAFEVPFKHK